MKNCPNGHEVNDNLNYCPKCGAEIIDNGAKFCAKCGNERKGKEKFCSKCGTPFEGVPTPQPIPQPTPSYDATETSTDYRKIIIPIVIGLVILALIGGGWFGYNKYTAYTAAKQAREKLISDSIESVRQDSLRMAEHKEKEELEAKKLAEFREKFTFGNLLALLKNYDNVGYAQKCGLSRIYKDVEDDGEIECTEIVYGYDVEKDGNNTVEAKSNNSCYLRYSLDSSTHAAMYFKNASDADYFQNIAKEYGLLVYDGSKYVPQKKISSGYHNVDSLDWEGDYAPTYMISDTSSENGWYIIHIGIDF